MNNTELTEEGNKLIAEFMEYPDLGTMGDFSYLKYHSSWDWLMPVVEKCKYIWDNEIHFDNGKVGILYVNIFNALNSLSTKDTHKAALVFINWYNQNKYQ